LQIQCFILKIEITISNRHQIFFNIFNFSLLISWIFKIYIMHIMPHLYVAIFFENLKFLNNFEKILWICKVSRLPYTFNPCLWIWHLYGIKFSELNYQVDFGFSQILLYQIGKLTSTSTIPPSLVCQGLVSIWPTPPTIFWKAEAGRGSHFRSSLTHQLLSGGYDGVGWLVVPQLTRFG